MFRRRRSGGYFAHDQTHRLLLAPDADDDGEFTCDGCQVVGNNYVRRRYDVVCSV
jgi:hypothetical protein